MSNLENIYKCTESQLKTARYGVLETIRYLKEKKRGEYPKINNEINRQIACLGITLHTINTIVMQIIQEDS